jgi:hypothetical protein
VRALVALAAFVLVAAAPKPALPPVAQLLQRYAEATALPGAVALSSLEIGGSVAGSGLQGEFHVWREGERELRESSLGPRHESTLFDGEHVSIRDDNGNVRELRGILARREVTQRFIDSGDFVEHPENVRLVGKARVRDHDAYKLEVRAPAGEPEALFVDARTGLMLREQYIEGDGPMTVDVNEWREVDGHLFPWKTTISDGEHAYDFVQQTVDVRVNPKIAATVFAPFVPRYLQAAQPVTVPLFEDESHYYCDVTVGTKTYRFLIDSGASGIVVDSRVAREQGLRQEGSLQVRGARRSGGLHLVRVPSLSIGGAVLSDLVGASLDLGGATGGTLRTDGILGYPLFAAGLVRIDPVSKTLTLASPDGFKPQGTALALELDRSLPEAQLGINGNIRAPFLLDTGNSSEVLLFRWFVQRHPGLVPFSADARSSFGIGGSTMTYRSVLDELEIAGTRLYQRDAAVVLATQGAFADRYDAGNVGLGVLRNFIVTFDEPHYAVYLQPIPSFDDGRHRALRNGNIGAVRLPTQRP